MKLRALTTVVGLAIAAASVLPAAAEDCTNLEDAEGDTAELLERFGHCALAKTFPTEPGTSEADSAAVLRAWELDIAMKLSRLGYGLMDGNGNVLTKPIEHWQRSQGRTPTGIPTFADIVAMRDLDDAFPPEDIFLGLSGDGPQVIRVDDLVTVEGTWVIEGEKHAFPLNKHIYRCWISTELCTHAEALVGQLGTDSNHLHLVLETLRITAWNPPGLTVEPMDAGGCRRPVMTINTETVEVFEVTTQGSACPEPFEALARPRVAQLVNSGSVAMEVMHEKDQRKLDHMAPAARAAFEEAARIVDGPSEN